METTPPPPQRLHTPPTPLHGTKHDSYEPYSPRRSSRVASQRKYHSHSQQILSTPPSAKRTAKRPARASTPTRLPSSSQNLSPPTSPASPMPPLSARKQKARKGALHAHFDAPSDLESNVRDSTSKAGTLSTLGMLPTPAKTPRKRAPQPQTSLKSTARVLFSDRPATVEDAMPDPKKNRRGKKNAFSLDSFEELEDDENSNSIPIYTDSKERLPEDDATDDNPFVTRKGANGTAKAQGRTKKAKPIKNQEIEEMEKRVEKGEGLIYVFRGKKVFRQYGDSDVDDEPSNVSPSTAESRRQAGALKRMTRSSITPRLLFPNEEQRRAREAAANAADEEAITDIEAAEADAADPMDIEESADIVTPVKDKFTALPTPRSSRGKSRTTATPGDDDHEANDSPESSVSAPNPFNLWPRSKSGSRSPVLGRKAKRGGDPMNGEVSKRTRSAPQHANGQ